MTADASIPSLAAIYKNTWSTPPTAKSFEVTVPISERQLHAQVIAGLFGPFINFSKVSNPNYGGNVFRGEYSKQEPEILANNLVLSGSPIVCVHPNEIKKAVIIAATEVINQDDSEDPKLVIVGMQYGSTDSG